MVHFDGVLSTTLNMVPQNTNQVVFVIVIEVVKDCGGGGGCGYGYDYGSGGARGGDAASGCHCSSGIYIVVEEEVVTVVV